MTALALHQAERDPFQSHLRPIHPIHLDYIHLLLLYYFCFNRICAPSTLSTAQFNSRWHSEVTVSIASAPHPPYPQIHKMLACLPNHMFQSHLRPIHPIHTNQGKMLCTVWTVSIASAPHPPYPLISDARRYAKNLVSIASAPHPPYPQRGASHGPGSGFRLRFSRQMVSLSHFSPVCTLLEEYSAFFSSLQSALGALRGSFVRFARH